MTRITVFAASGKIPHCRFVRLTGRVSDGCYEVAAVGTGRAHALILPHPNKEISPTEFGHAHCLGPVLEAEAGLPVKAGDDLVADKAGCVVPAKPGDKRCCAVAVTSSAKGGQALIIVRTAMS